MAGHMPHWSRVKAKARRVRAVRKTTTHSELREAMRSLGGVHPAVREMRERVQLSLMGLRTRPVA